MAGHIVWSEWVLMSEDANSGAGRLERLDEEECLRLISPGGVGRLAFVGRYGVTVHPVNYALNEGAIVFRTGQDSATDEDLRTGIQGAAYQVGFEVDDIDPSMKGGWSVLVQGAAHHVNTPEEREPLLAAGVEAWAGGARDLFFRIVPSRITGRRIRRD